MRPLIAGCGTAELNDVLDLQNHPDFRKATLPMQLAFTALSRALAPLPESAKATLPKWGIVVGVDHGELEVTKEFLCTLATRNLARPFLFQNALHNATLGFISLRLGIQGPGITTSTRHFAGEDALNLATDLLAAGDCEACICVGVEAIDQDMLPAVKALYPVEVVPYSQAGALILVTPKFKQLHKLNCQLILAEIELNQTQGPRLGAIDHLSRPYHGADAIGHLATLAQKNLPADLILTKPDGATSRCKLTGIT